VKATLTGYSDDIIALTLEDPGLKIEEEFPANGDDGDLVCFSDGTILRIVFNTDGVWVITPVVKGLGFSGIEEPADDNYSYTATVLAVWAVHGTAHVKPDGLRSIHDMSPAAPEGRGRR